MRVVGDGDGSVQSWQATALFHGTVGWASVGAINTSFACTGVGGRRSSTIATSGIGGLSVIEARGTTTKEEATAAGWVRVAAMCTSSSPICYAAL